MSSCGGRGADRRPDGRPAHGDHRFGIAKDSEDTYFRNHWVGKNLAGMKANEIVQGVYHFLTFEDVGEQLALFLDQVGDTRSLMVAGDVEEVV